MWFAVTKLVDVGIVLMKQCLVLFPEMCLSLVFFLVSRVLNLISKFFKDSVDKFTLLKTFAYCIVT